MANIMTTTYCENETVKMILEEVADIIAEIRKDKRYFIGIHDEANVETMKACESVALRIYDLIDDYKYDEA